MSAIEVGHERNFTNGAGPMCRFYTYRGAKMHIYNPGALTRLEGSRARRAARTRPLSPGDHSNPQALCGQVVFFVRGSRAQCGLSLPNPAHFDSPQMVWQAAGGLPYVEFSGFVME